ncbi:cyclohexanone monooxygenase [Arthroderma uncinatum]|uniref:cyclohexanone monooxygenase n=1 Tax=Arthroderma uncinatum TaxID=74035 RepID=UPI00144AAD20|nr:cyclohexanone monooxygenase [Arthroderma uncinatum]KAF3480237.1 cyclohexanone monooxygenase [Arthroderma uncinatum]
MMGSVKPSSLEIPDQPHSNPARIRIIHIGAGASGILTAYKAKKLLRNYDLTCYEKNETIGGTWLENKYPVFSSSGCACDIPAHVYTYPFEGNPDWGSFYAPSDEIEGYLRRFYEKHELQGFFRFNTEVISATWDGNLGQYIVQLRGEDGKTTEDWCHALINGSGVSNKWKWPDIPGLDSFKGPLMHTAAWKKDVEVQGKRIAVIGGGSSSVQVVPEMQKVASQLYVCMRSPLWVCPPSASDILERSKVEQATSSQEQSDVQGTAENPHRKNAANQYIYSPKEKETFAKDNQAELLKYRRALEKAEVSEFAFFLSGSEINKEAKKEWAERMDSRMGPGHEELKKMIIPTSSLYGVNGLSIRDWWNPLPKPYLATTTPHFPNYFHINGPRGNWALGCAMPSIGAQIEYAMKCIAKMSDDQVKAMEVREDVTQQLNDYFDAWHSGSVWGEKCKSWYKNNTTDGPVMLWAGSLVHMLKTLQTPRFEHYRFEYRNSNMWTFLKNGRTAAEVEGRWDDAVAYLRNEDVPYHID